jgi:hypothetical protein
MSLVEELLFEIGREGIYFFIKQLGILFKWIWYFGKKPISTIKQENGNTRIGFILFICGILWAIYYVA